MILRVGRRKYNIKAMDIESHNDSESIAKGETSMWLGCYIDENSKMEEESSYFYNMDQWLDILEKESKGGRTEKGSRKCKNLMIYIYNLSFEWSFILPYLIKRGFTFKEKIDAKEDSFVFNSVSTKSCSSVWNVNLKFGKNCGIIQIKDLAKIFGGGLGKVAKSFNLPTQKGEIDYRLNRLHGHIVTKEEKEYCFKDTRIIIDILLKMAERKDKDFFKSLSMASYSMKQLLKAGWPRSCKPYTEYRKIYPELGQEETEFLRQGVEGGITYAPAQWQYKIIDKTICHIDAHQMHPSSAYLNLFPYGEGEYFRGKPPLGRICACRIRISYDDVKLHSIIKLIGLDAIEDFELVVWDFEIPTMKKCYVNLKIEYIEGYAYKMRRLPFRRYYAENYNKRLEAKRNKDDFNILYYKLLNNSSYGKLLENPHNVTLINYINDFGIIDSMQEPKEEIEINARFTYIPVGSCIPAYSRVALIELALKIGWKKILYFDTDSIFFLWDKKTEAVWNETNQEDFLGGWGLEEFIDKAQFTAPKRYKTLTNGKLSVKAGGINFKEWLIKNGYMTEEEGQERPDISIVPFEEINIISSKWNVQRAYRVKGGTLIEFQEKEIQVPKKYTEIYERNVK